MKRWKLVDSECVARDVKESKYITVTVKKKTRDPPLGLGPVALHLTL